MSRKRIEMPTVEKWANSLREVFGVDDMNAAIKAASEEGTLYASENGRTIGSPSTGGVTPYVPPSQVTSPEILREKSRQRRR